MAHDTDLNAVCESRYGRFLAVLFKRNVMQCSRLQEIKSSAYVVSLEAMIDNVDLLLLGRRSPVDNLALIAFNVETQLETREIRSIVPSSMACASFDRVRRPATIMHRHLHTKQDNSSTQAASFSDERSHIFPRRETSICNHEQVFKLLKNADSKRKLGNDNTVPHISWYALESTCALLGFTYAPVSSQWFPIWLSKNMRR